MIYNKHANIIIAESGSTATDVYKLSERMKKAVLKKFNIELIREIQLWNPSKFMEELDGQIERILFRNDESGYSVFNVKVKI